VKRSALLLALAVAGALSACGGGGPPLTHREFARDVARICRRANARVDRIDVPTISTPRQAADAFERIEVTERAALVELRRLVPPKGVTADVEKWLAVLDQMLDEVAVVRDALRRGDVFSALETAARAMTLDERARDLARALRVQPCRLAVLVPSP
jgi:hypothetical protein